MSTESARAAVGEALTKALAGETTRVSPTEHGVSAAELAEIANEQRSERDAAARHEISFVTESREEDGTIVFRPSTSS